MKKMYYLFVAIIGVIVFLQCQKKELDPNTLKEDVLKLENRSGSQDFEDYMDEIWDFHNNVVLELISSLQNPTIHEIIDGFDKYNQDHGNYFYDRSFTTIVLNKMHEDDNYLAFLKNQSILTNLPSALKNEVVAVMNVFVSSYTSREDLLLAIISLKNNTASLEVYASLIIAEASYHLWDDYFGNDSTAAIGPLVQADCIGYLWGWAGAWWSDQGPDYSNSWPAVKKRMGVGLATAGAASTLGKIKYH